MLEPILLNRSEIDSGRWDLLIADSVTSVFYGFSWYLDTVSESWQALVWPSAENYQLVMPLPIKKRLGFPVLYQPHFCQFLGIFSESEITVEIAGIFLESCISHFSYISSYSFHPDLSGAVEPLLNRFPAISFVKQQTFRKSLARNQSYNADRKRNLRRGIESNWVIEEGINTAELISLFSLHHSGNIKGGVSVQSYRILEKLVSAFRLHGNATLRYASVSGKIHASILIFRYGDYAVYIFNAADEKGRKGNARTVMLNNYFMEHEGTDLLFDFESAQEPHIHAFYRSFGGADTPFVSMSKTHLCFPLNYFQSLRRYLIRTRRALLLILYRT